MVLAPTLPTAPAPMADEAGGAPLPNELVATVVPAQILHEDEIVILLTKPSILFIFYTSFRFLLGTVLAGMLASRLFPFNNYSIALTTVLVVIGRLIWALLVWTSHVYMLTNQRIVTIKGVMSVNMFQANLRKIQNTNLFRPVIQRALNTGTIGFSTAAGGIESTWTMIARPIETHEQVVAAINKMQSK